MVNVTKSKVSNSADNGHNVINGDGFNNRIYAQYGNDTVRAGGGQDFIDGGGDNDVLYGETGNDTILGGLGRDTIWGGAGNDILTGGTGTFNPNDILTGATKVLTTPDRAVDNFFFSFNEGVQSDTILGFERGIDKIRIDAKSDLVISYNNDSSIISYGIGRGLKSTIEVQGVQVEASDIASNVRVSVPAPVAPVAPAVPVNTAPANPETTPSTQPAAPDSGNVAGLINGTPGDDYKVGSNDADTINGLGGKDQLFGAHGDDVILGGEGADKIWGGHGSDYLVGGSVGRERDGAADVFFFEKSDGLQSDTIAGFESGRDKIDLSGMSREDICIISSTSTGSIIRYNHFDSQNITGIVDQGFGEASRHLLVPSANITLNGSTIKSTDIETNARVIVINEQANSIVGTLGNDIIDGLGGNDSIYGNHGNDIIYGGTGADQIWGGHGSDVMCGGTYSLESQREQGDGVCDDFYFIRADSADGSRSVDIIRGFEDNVDKIHILGLSEAEKNTVRIEKGNFSGDFVITYLTSPSDLMSVAQINVSMISGELTQDGDIIFGR